MWEGSGNRTFRILGTEWMCNISLPLEAINSFPRDFIYSELIGGDGGQSISIREHWLYLETFYIPYCIWYAVMDIGCVYVWSRQWVGGYRILEWRWPIDKASREWHTPFGVVEVGRNVFFPFCPLTSQWTLKCCPYAPLFSWTSGSFYAIWSKRRAFSVHFVLNHTEFVDECAHKRSRIHGSDGGNDEGAATTKSANRNRAIGGWMVVTVLPLLLLLVCFAQPVRRARVSHRGSVCACKKDAAAYFADGKFSFMKMASQICLCAFRWLHFILPFFCLWPCRFPFSPPRVQHRLRVTFLCAAVSTDVMHTFWYIQFDVPPNERPCNFHSAASHTDYDSVE